MWQKDNKGMLNAVPFQVMGIWTLHQPRLILCHGLCLWWMLSFTAPDATHLISGEKNNTLTVNVNIWVYGSTMNNCDIIKGTSPWASFTCTDHISRREGEKGNRQFCAFHPLWEDRHRADKSQGLNPNSSWQRGTPLPILVSLWCQSRISPMTFFQRKSRFPRDSTRCTSTAYYWIGKRRPPFSFHIVARQDVCKFGVKIKTAHTLVICP